MGELRFPPKADVVRLVVDLQGPVGDLRPVRMILDTGASYVVVRPEIAERLGFDLAACPRQTIHSAHRKEDAPRFTIDRVETLGCSADRVEAIALRLPVELGADGLLGNTFLRRFRLDLDFPKGELRLAPPA